MEIKGNKGSLAGSPAVVSPEPAVPTVQVSGRFSHPEKAEAYPTNLDFANTATGEKFSAAIAKDQYSVQLPNHQSYLMSLISGDPAVVAEVGTLVLNTTAKAYSCDISW